MHYVDTRVIAISEPRQLVRLFSFLLRLVRRGPRSVKVLLAVTIERDTVFISPGRGAVKVDFTRWVDRQLEGAGRDG